MSDTPITDEVQRWSEDLGWIVPACELMDMEIELAKTKKALNAIKYPHESINGSVAVILYFPTVKDKDEFVKLVISANPRLEAHDL